MPIDIILVSLAALSGFVWAADVALFRARREADVVTMGEGDDGPKEPVAVEYARTFFPVIMVVLVIRSFLFEPFRIPSDSMMPTLLDGDFIFVNKFVFGLRLPVTNTKVVEFGEPRRGDVVVFRHPSNPQTNFIKRVVGLPGDRIVYQNKRLTINGETVPWEVAGDYTSPYPPRRRSRQRARVAVETLGEVEHRILLNTGGQRGIEGRFTVPEGHYFLMGDNRDNSRDSRYPDVSYVPEANLVGKAVRIWMNWNIPDAAPIWTRIGDRII